MGACLSFGAPPHLIDRADGDEKDYHDRYMEDTVLGEGEFGQVKLVHDMKRRQGAQQQQQQQNDQLTLVVDEPLACKVLRKGAVFKDNTLYSPIQPSVLKGEIQMLRKLNGQHYCLKMVAVYETPKTIFMITEMCAGGEMMEYVSKRQEDLRTEDVSRIAFQLLDALAHCAHHRIIHRDVKPENIMFKDPTPQSELRLIDFGSGTMEPPKEGNEFHTTFAGSAFYISPEMFQRTYSEKTDVWSAGATLYVLVAGYPASCLQKAFNQLQTKDRNVKELPNMPQDMPESFYDLLSKLLTYRHRHRPSAAEMKESEFCQFHKQQQQIEYDTFSTNDNDLPTRPTHSMSLKGSVGRHSIVLNFQKYERSLTALLAATLTRNEFNQLMLILKQRMVRDKTFVPSGTATNGGAESKEDPEITRLSVIKVLELKSILAEDMNNPDIVETMKKIPQNELFDDFAYHVTLLRDFSIHSPDAGADESRGRRRIQRSNSFTGRALMMTSSNSSVKSNRSLGGKRHSTANLSRMPPLPKDVSRSISS